MVADGDELGLTLGVMLGEKLGAPVSLLLGVTLGVTDGDALGLIDAWSKTHCEGVTLIGETL